MSAKTIFKSIQDVIKKDLEGIKIHIPTDTQDLREVNCTISGPQNTPFENGDFDCKLRLTDSYPKEPPKGFFVTKIFHPNVEPRTGEICVNTLKSDWNPSLGLDHVLLTIRCLLINPNAESALNEEAGKLLLDDYFEFANRARIMTKIYAKSKEKENQPDKSVTTGSSTTSAASITQPVPKDSNVIKKKKRNLKRL